jgi:hypothetical protein
VKDGAPPLYRECDDRVPPNKHPQNVTVTGSPEDCLTPHLKRAAKTTNMPTIFIELDRGEHLGSYKRRKYTTAVARLMVDTSPSIPVNG